MESKLQTTRRDKDIHVVLANTHQERNMKLWLGASRLCLLRPSGHGSALIAQGANPGRQSGARAILRPVHMAGLVRRPHSSFGKWQSCALPLKPGLARQGQERGLSRGLPLQSQSFSRLRARLRIIKRRGSLHPRTGSFCPLHGRSSQAATGFHRGR